MEKIINENHIKIRGFKEEIPEALKLGDDLTIVLQTSCITKQIFDNQDGSVNVIYEMKPKIIIIKEYE